jgi:hypothetical protein
VTEPHNDLNMLVDNFVHTNLIKLFWLKFTHAFCKLVHFIKIGIFVTFLRKDLAYKMYAKKVL